MTRLEIITRFREENPEITSRVVTDAVLNTWCLVANQEICARARLIVNDGTFAAVENEDAYDLNSRLTNFFDIDEIPGGGVSIIDDDSLEKRLIKTTIAELDDKSSSWRTSASARPRYFYRRGKYIHLYPIPNDTIATIHVYYVQIPDDFDDDAETPYNQLTHLEPFHYGIVKYLTWRAKSKVGKPEDAARAMTEYDAYIQWIKKEVGGGKYGPVYFRRKA